MDSVTRFGVSVPSRLLKRFDKLITELVYTKRSKAIKDTINEFIVEKQLVNDGKVVGTISYAFNHHVSDVKKSLVELQHKYEDKIKSTMHSHIAQAECVEVFIVEGTTRQIQKLYVGLSAVRGVENCKLAILKKKQA